MRVAVTVLLLFLQQGVDFAKILQRADALLEESKTAYEEARAKSSGPGFVEAGFKLEEARIKYLAVQEVGGPEHQKIAADRLRAVNQLSKLIHDGKVAVSGTPAESPVAKTVDAPPKPGDLAPAPATVAPPASADVTRRAAVPDAAKQREAEKLIRDLYKDQYAKKAPADRKALAKALLEQTASNRGDAPALWVFCREAQDLAAQACDVPTLTAAVDAAAGAFDVDPLPMKSAALASAAKAAKAPDEFEALAVAHLDLVEDFVRADQYDLADKAAVAAVGYARKSNVVTLALRATTRSREITEAKTIFLGMKGVMEALAKSPDDPAANLEMGKYLCFVKGSWDLGPRFLVKGSDATLKSLAEKELAMSLVAAERLAVADGWYDLGAQDKSPLRRSQLQSHARSLYEAVLPDLTSLQRIRVEKRLGELPKTEAVSGTGFASASGSVNLLPLIDPQKDLVSGLWRTTAKGLVSPKMSDSMLQVPYIPPDEYDLEVVAELQDGDDGLGIGLASGQSQVMMVIGSWGQTANGLRFVDGKYEKDNATAFPGPVFQRGRPLRILCSVRKSSITVTADGKRIVSWKSDWSRLSVGVNWTVPRKDTLFFSSINNVYEITRYTLTPVSGQGKKLR